MSLKLLILAIFAIAMAHVEGVVVVYLRKMLGISDTELKNESVSKFPKRYLFIEKTREIATIVMLVSLSLLVGNTWFEKILVFLWTFAFWDLFYYLSLYVLIKWPPKLTTMDVLFLIPRPWIAPVWFPIGVSFVTIIAIIFVVRSGLVL
jgi:hypothetical protein